MQRRSHATVTHRKPELTRFATVLRGIEGTRHRRHHSRSRRRRSRRRCLDARDRNVNESIHNRRYNLDDCNIYRASYPTVETVLSGHNSHLRRR